jgi:hypothetical protein
MLENRNWNGVPIYPTKYDNNKPDSESYFKSAPEWAVGLSKTLNSWTGGNAGRSGSVMGLDTDISPETISHMTDFVGGGTARFVLNAYKTGQRLGAGEEWLPESTPIVKSFYGSRTRESDRREFYTAWDKIDAGMYEYKTLQKAGDRAATAEARTRNLPEISVWKLFDKTKDALKDLRTARDRVKASDTLSAEERRAKIDALDNQEQELIRRATQIYISAEKRAGETP